MKVTQFCKYSNGKYTAVKNHFILWDKESQVEKFQSYDTIIASFDGKKLLVSEKWNFSATTSKHFYNWLEQNFPYIGKVNKSLVEKMLSTGFLCIGKDGDGFSPETEYKYITVEKG